MTATAWAVLLIGGGALVLFASWNYRAREVPVAGRSALTALRAGALLLLLLLLLNPRLPWSREGAADAWTLLDLSASMAAAERAAWERAVGEATGTRVVGFGTSPRALTPDSLSSLRPDEGDSRLAPALRVAAEGGARSVRVTSDLRIPDLGPALAEAGRLGVEVGFLDTGEPLVNAGLALFEAPEVGDEDGFDVALSLFGEGARGDSARIEVREEERLVAATSVAVPAPGSTVRVSLRLPGPTSAGPLVRYTAQVRVAADGFADDDQRVAYVFREGEEGGMVFASFRPDFEPRFLAPALQAATGLRPTILLRVGPDRFLVSGVEGPESAALNEEQARRRLETADLAVVHGVGRDRPEWLDPFLVRAPRLLLLPAAPQAVEPLGLTATGPIEAEWTLETVLPPSPVAGQLAGLGLESVPPLVSAITLGEGANRFSLIEVRRDGRGRPEPAIVLGGTGTRRWAVSLADGFHRWALRGGGPAEAYGRLWGAVGGWLVSGTTAAAGDRVRPEDAVVRRGDPVVWVAPGLAGDSVRITLEADAAYDTVLAVDGTERATMTPRPVGLHRFRARLAADTTAPPLGEGRFDVEAYTGELRTPPQDPERVGAEVGSGASVRMLGRQRLRTSELPYLLLIGLLLTEWIARRRRGLR